MADSCSPYCSVSLVVADGVEMFAKSLGVAVVRQEMNHFAFSKHHTAKFWLQTEKGMMGL